jgi:coenzyme PQQ precursor peptide PqqA
MLSAVARGAIHENHEVPFMKAILFATSGWPDHRFRGDRALAAAVRRCGIFQRKFPMTWQTPTAIDWRFGFEISLYVANR